MMNFKAMSPSPYLPPGYTVIADPNACKRPSPLRSCFKPEDVTMLCEKPAVQSKNGTSYVTDQDQVMYSNDWISAPSHEGVWHPPAAWTQPYVPGKYGVPNVPVSANSHLAMSQPQERMILYDSATSTPVQPSFATATHNDQSPQYQPWNGQVPPRFSQQQQVSNVLEVNKVAHDVRCPPGLEQPKPVRVNVTFPLNADAIHPSPLAADVKGAIIEFAARARYLRGSPQLPRTDVLEILKKMRTCLVVARQRVRALDFMSLQARRYSVTSAESYQSEKCDLMQAVHAMQEEFDLLKYYFGISV